MIDTFLDSAINPLINQNSNVVQSPQGDATVAANGSAISEDVEKFTNFNQASVFMKQLVSQWSAEVLETQSRRKTRKIDINVDKLRESGDINEDETFVPVRVVDTNIKLEQPSYINFLRNSRRLAIFTCLSQPNKDTQLLEQDFTKGMTYPGWEIPHYKCIDGFQAHAWDANEVVFDESLPLHVGLEQVGHDKLFFSFDALDPQNCNRIMRAYDLTLGQLNEYVKLYGFNKVQVDALTSSRKTGGVTEETTFRVYKTFYKLEGVINLAWCSLDGGVTDWLCGCKKLFLGRKKKVQVPITVNVPVQIGIDPATNIPVMQDNPVQQMEEQWVNEDETNYPIFLTVYQETEEQRITDHKGRVFLDSGKQEAQTAVLTGFVNGVTRAANIYGSPMQDDGNGGPAKLTDMKLLNGAVVSKPFNFWSTPYPDPMVLKVMQYMDTHNSQEAGNPAYTVMNRDDSRKTAKELGMAENESQKLDSVQLTLFSTHIRLIYSFVWLIVQSQALQGKLPYFLLKQDEQGNYVQDVDTISQVYDIRAAGDVDVIQKQELIGNMKQDWPVICNTPLAMEFLIDILKLQYPNDAVRYEQILRQGDQKKQIIIELATALTKLVPPQVIQSLPPAQKQQLAQLNQQTQQVIQQP